MGRDGGSRFRMRRRFDGGAGHWDVATDDLRRVEAVEKRIGERAAGRTYSSEWRRVPADHSDATGIEGGVGDAGRTGQSRRSRIAAALDLQGRATTGPRTEAAGVSDRSAEGRRVVARHGLQPSRQPQDARGERPFRSRRAVQTDRRHDRRVSVARPARRLRRYEEEGARRPLQKRGPRVALPPATPKRFASTTSWMNSWARPSPTASRIWPPTKVG